MTNGNASHSLTLGMGWSTPCCQTASAGGGSGGGSGLRHDVCVIIERVGAAPCMGSAGVICCRGIRQRGAWGGGVMEGVIPAVLSCATYR